MSGKFLAGAALLGSLVIAGDAFAANMWRTNHGHGGGGGTSANVSSNSGTTFNAGTNNAGTNASEGGNGYNGGGPNGTVGVPEPSSLYAVGSALALLGAAGWALRRKQ
jgi:hypothetical protein